MIDLIFSIASSEALIIFSVLCIHSEIADTTPEIIKEAPIVIAELSAIVATFNATVFTVAPTKEITYPPRLAFAPFKPVK